MAGKRQGLQIWVLVSVALMLLGAFGPWVKALGQSVGGTDGSNDGWFVVAAAGLAGLLFYLARTRRVAGIWPLLGGIGGLGVTLYDRNNIHDAISGNALAQALVQVGWGLNLAVIASASLTLAGLVWLLKSSETATANVSAEPVTVPAAVLPPDPPAIPSTPPSV